MTRCGIARIWPWDSWHICRQVKSLAPKLVEVMRSCQVGDQAVLPFWDVLVEWIVPSARWKWLDISDMLGKMFLFHVIFNVFPGMIGLLWLLLLVSECRVCQVFVGTRLLSMLPSRESVGQWMVTVTRHVFWKQFLAMVFARVCRSRSHQKGKLEWYPPSPIEQTCKASKDQVQKLQREVLTAI